MEFAEYIDNFSWIVEKQAIKFREKAWWADMSWEDVFDYGLAHMAELYGTLKSFRPAEITNYLKRCLQWYYSKFLRKLMREKENLRKIYRTQVVMESMNDFNHAEEELNIKTMVKDFCKGANDTHQAVLNTLMENGYMDYKEIATVLPVTEDQARRAITKIRSFFSTQYATA